MVSSDPLPLYMGIYTLGTPKTIIIVYRYLSPYATYR